MRQPRRILRHMTVASLAETLNPARRQDHTVQLLIAVPAPKLAQSLAWPLLGPLTCRFPDCGGARRMAAAIAVGRAIAPKCAAGKPAEAITRPQASPETVLPDAADRAFA
jgi:hypothetical protein